jgi:hypothetical protein
VTSPLDPEQVAAHLDGLGETAAADLVRAMVHELATARSERDVLAHHTRGIAGLPGHEMSHNCRLIGPAIEALDVLRVTRRCPSTEAGQHWPLRRLSGDLRCAWCHARLPGSAPHRT